MVTTNGALKSSGLEARESVLKVSSDDVHRHIDDQVTPRKVMGRKTRHAVHKLGDESRCFGLAHSFAIGAFSTVGLASEFWKRPNHSAFDSDATHVCV